MPTSVRLTSAFCPLLAVLAALVTVVSVPTAASADQVRDQEWMIDALGLTEAQAISQGEGVTVGVLDSGSTAITRTCPETSNRARTSGARRPTG